MSTWHDVREWMVARIRALVKSRLMPLAGMVGVIGKDRPVIVSPLHPKAGQALFIGPTLPRARHFLDHLLFSLRISTPKHQVPLSFFWPHHPAAGDSLAYREHADKRVLDPAAAWRTWAVRIERGEVPGTWKTYHLLVVDDLRWWWEHSDETTRTHITRVLTRGFRQRVWVLATTTYDDWPHLPEVWRRAFRIGYYIGGRGLLPENANLPKSILQTSPDAVVLPREDDTTLVFHSVVPEALPLLAGL